MEKIKLKMYRPFKWTETCVNDMNVKDWERYRKEGPHGELTSTIGGSDIGTILGTNKYKTKTELYNEKIGIHAMDKSNPEIFQRGHLFEETIARCMEADLREEFGEENVDVYFDKYMYGCGELLPEFAERTGCYDFTDFIEKEGYSSYEDWYLHKIGSGEEVNLKTILRYPYMIFNYDCYVVIRIEGKEHIYLGEIKTNGANDFDAHRNWKNNIIPASYDMQCRYYMKGLNLSDKTFICCAWGLDKADRAICLVKRDDAIEEDMMEMADEFVTCVESKVQPDEDASAEAIFHYLERLYADPGERSISATIEIPEKYRSSVERLSHADELIAQYSSRLKAAENLKTQALNELFPLFKDAQKGEFVLDDENSVYIELKESYARDFFDEERLKKDYPAIYGMYSKKKEVFDKAAFKKNEGGLYSKYVIKGAAKGERKALVKYYDRIARRVKFQTKATDGSFLMIEKAE